MGWIKNGTTFEKWPDDPIETTTIAGIDAELVILDANMVEATDILNDLTAELMAATSKEVGYSIQRSIGEVDTKLVMLGDRITRLNDLKVLLQGL